MTSPVEATAPGKAFVSGEYAVLHGAPAVVMALNRRAVVTATRIDGDAHEVTAPGYSDITGRFELARASLRWLGQPLDTYALFQHVLETSGVELGEPTRFSLDTRAFVSPSSGEKFGMGSSAALAAALATVLAELAGADPMPAAVFGHREFQGGKGSGGDVAAALAGGIIEYRMDESGWAVLDWPVRLRFRFFFSGVSASTDERIERSAQADADIAALGESAAAVSEAFRIGNPRAILAAMRDNVTALRHYSDAAGLDVFGAGHDVLADAAADFGLVYKPCGAGGGDIGIAVGHDDRSLDVFAALAESQGYRPLELELDPVGARITE